MSDTKFWDRIAPKYAKDPITDPAAYEYTLGRTRSYLNDSDRVLELGCGTGSTALLLAPGVGHLTATDFSAGMIAIAQAKPRTSDNISFAVQDRIPASGRYDAVLAFNLLHLMPDPDARLREIHALLPEGGYFISKTACLKSGLKWRLISMVIPLMQLVGKAPGLVNGFSVETLEGYITDAGFDIIESGDHPAPSRYVVARKRAA